MLEQAPSPTLPSGYESSHLTDERLQVSPAMMPWLKEPISLNLAECRLTSGETFYLASAIGTHPRLIEAAEGMTDSQKKITDNMFYSRLPRVIIESYSPSVETYPNPSTSFPIKVMRNKGGQRVYFGKTEYRSSVDDSPKPLIIRLSACDKNKQGLIYAVISNATPRQNKRGVSK